jgi:hypothetical protein
MAPKKDPSQLSTNKHTQNERKRRANKTGYEKQLLNLKRANQGKIEYQVKKIKKSDAYATADEAERQQMLENSKNTVIADL